MTEDIQKSKILVTGASGFIGRALIARLLKEVTPNNLIASSHSNNLNISDPVFKQLSLSLDATTNWLTALDNVKVVVHCAARVHVMKETVSDSLALFRTINVDGTLNLADQAAAMGIRRFIFLSSVKVNGESTAPGQSFGADDIPAPKDAYGISKMEAENGLLKIGRNTGMEIVIIRPPLVYGPGVKANFAKLIHWISNGIPLPFGSVQHNRRSLVAIDNLIDLIMCCLEHPAAANEIFMVSDGKDISSAALIEQLGHAMGKSPKLLSISPKLLRYLAGLLGKSEISDRLLSNLQVDISKTTQRLNWTPCIDTREGFNRLFNRVNS